MQLAMDFDVPIEDSIEEGVFSLAAPIRQAETHVDRQYCHGGLLGSFKPGTLEK